MSDLASFVAESNAIEGIRREPLSAEVQAHMDILCLEALTVPDIVRFVDMIAPGHVLRDRPGLNVTVGSHRPPAGGADITWSLSDILRDVNGHVAPYDCHCAYEKLHPFTDGNGRSGRMIWLWQMTRLHGGAPLGFLHHWYYQSLEAMDR